MQEDNIPRELTNVPVTGADKVAYAFYATAATAALVGQVWAGVTHIPWPEDGFPMWTRIALVTPAVAVIELGGVATAALADLRRRKGEQAYAYRAMSMFAALVALVFNVVGHWRPEERFLAFGFGGLSAFAYVLWLIHSSARRRDALRAAGQMAKTGPVYGVVQWLREPRVTWLARSLALEHGYGLYESLRQARERIRTTARRVAIAGTVAEFIRSEQQDERLAKIAETTYDPDRLAAMLEERIDYEVVTNKLTKAIAPTADEEEQADVVRPRLLHVQLTATQSFRQNSGLPLRGADDQWRATVAGGLPTEYLPYDRPAPASLEAGESPDAGETEVAAPERSESTERAEPPVAVAEPVVTPSPDAQPTVTASSPVEPAPAVSAGAAKVAEPVDVRPVSEQNEPNGAKKKVRAWALLSDWPADRERNGPTLAAAIASSESYAWALIRQYDEEQAVKARMLVGSQSSPR